MPNRNILWSACSTIYGNNLLWSRIDSNRLLKKEREYIKSQLLSVSYRSNDMVTDSRVVDAIPRYPSIWKISRSSPEKNLSTVEYLRTLVLQLFQTNDRQCLYSNESLDIPGDSMILCEGCRDYYHMKCIETQLVAQNKEQLIEHESLLSCCICNKDIPMST